MKTVLVLIGSLMLSSLAFAQNPPPPPGDRPEGPPPRELESGGGPGPRERGPGGMGGPGMRPGGRGGMPGGMGGGMGEGPEGRMRHIEMMRGYLEVVDRYARMATDPDRAGIAAVVTAADILKPRGADTAIEYFNKIMPETKSPAVQRAIRLQLIELYKMSGKQDEALTQLKSLMTAEPTKAP
jgi:hypothetical protein